MGVIIAVLGTLVNFILKILTLAAKLIYKLIRLLGLQFPVFYLLVMLVIELCTDHAISSDPQRVSLFWLGFVLSLVCAGCDIVRRLFFPKRRRDETYYRKKFEREQEKERERESRRARTVAVDSGTVSSDIRVESSPVIPENIPDEIITDPPVSPTPGTEATPPISAETVEIREQPLAFASASGGRIQKKARYPQIYRVKQDERFLVYEYEDRSELYFEKPSGLKLIRIEKK